MVLSEQGIYVSRHAGHDTKTCGNVSSPCRTISYGIQQMSTGLYIYLDGTDTLKNPYACEAFNPGHPRIYLNKSASFVGIKSRAHISCSHVNAWLVDGTEHKNGIRISFSGLAFLNTSVRLFDAFVAVDDTVFAKAKLVSLDIQVRNLPRLDLSLNNVIFKKNTACMIITPKRSKSFVNITNTVFYQNGNPSSIMPSILYVHSNFLYTSINTHLRNCSFEKNTFKKYGMIFVVNKLGTTKVLLKHLTLKENMQIDPSTEFYAGLFTFISVELFFSLEYGSIYKTSGTFLHVMRGHSAKVNISNIGMNEFYSGSPGGGVVNVIKVDSCYLSIKDSSFRNGNNYDAGGIIYIDAKNATLTIQNSSIHNISSSKRGAVFIKSISNDYVQPTNRNKRFIVSLRIINSSLSHSSSRYGGAALFVLAKTLSAIIRDSSFLQCNSTVSGSILFFYTNDIATILLRNSYFLKNGAHSGAIVHIRHYSSINVSINISITSVTFSQNRLCSQQIPYSIVFLESESRKNTVHFKNTHFIKNFVERGSSIFINFHSVSTSRFVTLDNCIFRNNAGYLGTVVVGGQTSLTCKHSIFDSNIGVRGSTGAAAFVIRLNDSTIFFMNTTFVNNFNVTIYAEVGGVSTLTITDSAFVRNKNIDHGGGTLAIVGNKNQPKNHFDVHVTKVLFQENIAQIGGVLSVYDAEVVFTNCTFLNNFGFFHGGLIHSGGCDSVNLSLLHSVFKQTIQKIVINNSKTFLAASFLRLFSPHKLVIVNTTFDQQTKSNDPQIFVPTAKSVLIDNASLSSCPLGHDIERMYYGYKGADNTYLIGLTFSCKECDYNFYSLQRGIARGLNVDDGFQCLPCPRGADCVPAIKSKKNYWGYHTSLNPPKLAFTICPFGYCKSPSSKSTKYNACQGKRTGVMCGMCSQGYTEALWSTNCTPVKDCDDYWFWILFLALVFSIAIILVFKPPFVTYCLKQIFWFRKSSRTAVIQTYDDIPSFSSDEEIPQENIPFSSTEQLKQDKRQFSRFVEIIFYFYQIAQLLLSSSSLKEFFDSKFLDPLLGFFNFQPRFTKQGFLCPFPGLTPETKLFFKIAPVFGTLIAIFFIYALHSFICRTRGAILPAIAPYFQASIKAVFLGYVTLAIVSISLIRCVFVAGESRWFYNGNVTCYHWWQYASFTFIAVFVIPFIFVLILVSFKLHHDMISVRQFILAIIFPLPFLMLWLIHFSCSSAVANVEENQNVNALKEMLLAPYRQPDERSKRGALYWQSVLIARRFILVLIFSIVAEPSIRLFCMTIVSVAVLCFHLKVKPFQNSLANDLESLSLFFLIILGLVNLFKSVLVGSKQNIKGSLITLLKVFQWLETGMLGLFPSALLLLLSSAVISFSFRFLVVCCRSIFKFFIKPCAQRWMSRDATPLLIVSDNTDIDTERYVIR